MENQRHSSGYAGGGGIEKSSLVWDGPTALQQGHWGVTVQTPPPKKFAAPS